jgi:predicted CXXCH cytochrome family protein
MKTILTILAVTIAAAALALGAASAPAQSTNVHDCSFCHVSHTAPGPVLTVALDAEVLCLTCHGPGGSSPLKADVHFNKPGSQHSFRMTCIDCHTPHSSLGNWVGGVNLKQVGTKTDETLLARIDTPNSGIREVVFESRGIDAGEASLHSFADNDEDGNGYYDGVCEACHTQTFFHRNDTADPGHYSGRTCVECHPHTEGFVATGGSCLDCHDRIQDNGDGVPPGGRRAVVAEFDLASHHVLHGGNLQDADCVVCHDMSRHMLGAVRLKDADDPENENLVVELASDPLTDPAAAVLLEPFCLACHDADGAGGAPPFSDGVFPVPIDAAAWSNASHRTGGSVPLTCFGDGGSFGCHSTGHGSYKRALLAPWDVAPTPPANAEEEEGFCHSCHDSDGPASSDIAGQFGAPVRWVTAPAGPLNNLNLNDRHDIQYVVQNRSGAKIECTDCHDPHTATAAAPWVADPDPDDGRVPGTGDILPGADFLTEWCLDCHDGSFPATVTPPSTTVTNVRTTYTSDDTHGLPGGNPNLKAGYGWAADQLVSCAACHGGGFHVATKTNLFQLADLVLSRDGTTPVPSDDVGLDYAMTDNNTSDQAVNGYQWCNTCHSNSMGRRRTNCFTCHYHGDSM